MISLERCRKILGPDCRLSDEDLERLRDELYALANIAITAFLENRDRDPAAQGTANIKKGIQPDPRE